MKLKVEMEVNIKKESDNKKMNDVQGCIANKYNIKYIIIPGSAIVLSN